MNTELNNLTAAQKLTIVTNAILTDFPKESVLRITKEVTKTHSPFGRELTETRINARVEKPTGKKATRKIFVRKFEGGELWVHLDTGYNRHTIEGLLSMELVNPIYNIDAKDIAANIAAEKAVEAERKAEAIKQKEIKSIIDEINYNLSPRAISRGYSRSPKQLKTSFKKYANEVMEEAKLSLDDKGMELLSKVQKELALPVIEKNNCASLLATVTNCNVLAVCKELEVTFEEESEELYARALAWFKKQDAARKKECTKEGYTFYPMSEKRMESNARYVVESNKFKLFGCVIRNLGKYAIESVERLSFDSYVQGFQGIWLLTMQDNSTLTFNARSIIAEGYHVCRHYRYIGTVTK